MSKTTSERNKTMRAACLCAAVLLCLGAFFVFFHGLMSSETADGQQSVTGRPEYSLLGVGAVPTPSVSAAAAVLMEASSGEIIWSRSPDAKLPMASTTKIMTALVAIENGNVDDVVTVSCDAVGIEGSSIYLYEGERLTLGDLLSAMLLESANDAATAIAIHIGGSVEGFADMMNAKAAELGLKSTHFTNPHGLDNAEHFTTARELAIIAREAMKNEMFGEIVSTYKKTIPLNETEGVRLLINHNKMLKRYDGACGIKTGYTKKSGRCLVSAAERDGLSFICVTLNAPDDWRDHTEMLDLGFYLYESRTLCGDGEFSYTMPVVGGESEYVILENANAVSLPLPRSAGEVTCTVELPRFLFAEVREGEVVGRLIFSVNGQTVAECDVMAKSSVERKIYKKGLLNLFTK
jgi:D-alanyl-D-alanine carboxypeptidase